MSGAAATTEAGRSIGSAQPYPWPYHGNFYGKGCALVACLDPTWRIAGPDNALRDGRLVRLAQALGGAGALVVVVTATPAHGRVDGAVRERTRRPIAGDRELQAGATSAFHDSVLDATLRAAGRSDLVIAGWGLEGPVHSTLRAANDRGYECLLVEDACTASDPDLAHAACEMVRFSGGIFGAFADTDSVVAWLADAR